jgi:hypothetical protein
MFRDIKSLELSATECSSCLSGNNFSAENFYIVNL